VVGVNPENSERTIDGAKQVIAGTEKKAGRFCDAALPASEQFVEMAQPELVGEQETEIAEAWG